MSDEIPLSHPRYASLMLRERIVSGVAAGITSDHGLLAHGRGEAFDYLIGEETNSFAQTAIAAAAAMLLLAEAPVISVNGNTAALVAAELVELSNVLDCPLEVNLFHASLERELRIAEHLRSHGAKDVLLPSDSFFLSGTDSNRRRCNPRGMFTADLVFVPLEDGDRCEALRGSGKEVITIDLNPASRTARMATISIVDNIVRAMPLLIAAVRARSTVQESQLQRELKSFSLRETLANASRKISHGFQERYDSLS